MTTIENLRQEYADVMTNRAVSDVTRWMPSNTSPEFSVDDVIAYSKKYASEMGDVIQKVFATADE